MKILIIGLTLLVSISSYATEELSVQCARKYKTEVSVLDYLFLEKETRGEIISYLNDIGISVEISPNLSSKLLTEQFKVLKQAFHDVQSYKHISKIIFTSKQVLGGGCEGKSVLGRGAGKTLVMGDSSYQGEVVPSLKKCVSSILWLENN